MDEEAEEMKKSNRRIELWKWVCRRRAGGGTLGS